MPAPIAPLLVLGAGVIIALMAGKKKTPTTVDPTPAPPIDPADYRPVPNPWTGTGTSCETRFAALSPAEQRAVVAQLSALSRSEYEAAIACGRDAPGPNPPPVDGKKAYAYTILGNSLDVTPGGFAQAWTGAYSEERIMQLSAVNPGLQKLMGAKVVFVQTSGAGDVQLDSTLQTAWLPAGVPVDRSVYASDAAGMTYPNNPTPGYNGEWRNMGGVGYALSPWQVGQTIVVPVEWGDPPASLAGSAAVIGTVA